jgi:cytosine/adenosine deaminase-related metal-dependent hydrolase
MTFTGARVALDANTTEIVDLAVSSGRISLSNPTSSDARSCPPTIDLTGFLVLPGLINAHDHLEFNLFPILGHGPYQNAKNWASDIYQPAVSPLKEHLALSKHSRVIWGGLKNLLSGVTTVAHHNPVDETIFGPSFPVNVVQHFGWAHSLDFSPDLVERFRTTPRDWPFILHAAEGLDEHARAEVRQLEALGVLSERTVLVHAIGLDQPDLKLLRARHSALVWCPTSNVSTYGQTIGPAVLRSGLNVALGTDSALTAQVDLLDEIEVARRTHQVAATDLFEMVTSRAARILRLTDGEGTIREGGVADLVVVEDRGQTPAEAPQQMRPEMVIVRGKVRAVSARFRERTPTFDTSNWHSINVEGRGKWFTNLELPSLHHETVRVLGPEYRLAGRRVSL